MGTRFTRAVVFAGLLTMAAASSTMAASITREPLGLPDVIEDTSCGYTILVAFPVNNQTITTRFDADGNEVGFHITGRLIVSFTNPDTDTTVTANISGPSRVDRRGDFYYLGAFSGVDLGGYEGILLFAGRLNDRTGEFSGHVGADICEVLAAA